MDFFGTHFQNIAQAIQLSVAPVFLLAGVGQTLNVLVGRLVRIVDRARLTEGQLQKSSEQEENAELLERLRVLAIRARLISRAIAFSVVSALLVPLVIVALFLSTMTELTFGPAIAVAFIIALLSLAVGYVYFLREVFVATAALNFSGPGDQSGVTQSLRRVLRNS